MMGKLIVRSRWALFQKRKTFRLKNQFVVIGMLLSGALCGCNSNSEQALASEVNSLINKNMPATQARISLERARFKCVPGDIHRDVICTRMATYNIVATCIQPVSLTVDRVNDSIEDIEVGKPKCAGL